MDLYIASHHWGFKPTNYIYIYYQWLTAWDEGSQFRPVGGRIE